MKLIPVGDNVLVKEISSDILDGSDSLITNNHDGYLVCEVIEDSAKYTKGTKLIVQQMTMKTKIKFHKKDILAITTRDIIATIEE